MKKIIFILSTAIALQGCQKFLDKHPFASLTPDKTFQNASDMALYVNSFYVDQTPSAMTIATTDNLSDNISGATVPTLMQSSTNANNVSGWSWGTLRNINYFLDNCNNSTAIPASTRNGFAAVAKYFRAWFYFGMVKQYGDVPWYSHALSPTDPALYKPRDPRTLVMDSIVADLDFAIANLPVAKDNSSSTITKWVALAFKSRVCLFEGTFRKYHTELNLTASATDFLQKSADAASQVMSSGYYKLHNTGKPLADYRALFTTETPWSDEMLLASVYSNALKQWSSLNYYFTSPTFGNRVSLNKQFVDTYLKLDGSRFTDQPNFDTINFVNEMQARDPRLQQTIRCNGYKRLDGSPAPPDYSGTFTGYQVMKYTLDDKSLDNKSQNNNSIPIIRYAEVLLNYAEAKAELGQFTNADWTNTIALLRARAGITNISYPATADTYLATTYFPNISDPALLEIRRERGIEFACEGYRFDDIRRWKAGYLMSMPYLGVYVPAMNTSYAMNGDGVLNVSFVSAVPSNPVKGVFYYVIAGNSVMLTNGTYGNIHWLANYDVSRAWQDKFYYYPIPTSELVLNPKLTQSPGW
ncbi:MAG: RagB/SusD family nutrient uptake outer membrane protein [Chitinophaga sp.]|uniref:RagB/SusD family nutrient uptake outer membrane protein n=1 Tax=Chitinophaga sp. TaxID=1869181 RepID=UPI0025BC16FF|nr:RagB/SusD family nutrient uptake outer membrane protein [Chitinophaga sp.]MBV8255237.1 RagB/SusD family nutrient uptake outer membrane protein [Chitinophaga sp.]